MAKGWNTCARELGYALSRYNGLTNSAKLDLVTDVIASDLFERRPFRYAIDIIQFFEQSVKLRSAEVHLHHSIAFGLLHRATSGRTVSHPNLSSRSRIEATSHIALAPLGRAVRAAVKLYGKKSDFLQFLWNYALLECDFDMYGLLIKMSEENNGEVINKEQFFSRFYNLRELQIKWMKEKFPYISHREQIQRNTQWIGKRVPKRIFARDEIFRFDGKTPTHHFTQRKKWAKNFGHIDESGNSLTKLGFSLASCLPSTDDRPFFWLGPSEECARSRIISAAKIPKEMCSPAWNLLRPQREPASPSKEIIEETASYMKDAFNFIRLGSFEQASLDSVVPYVYFLQYSSGERVNEHELFRTVLKDYRDRFACSLQPNLSQSHYRFR